LGVLAGPQAPREGAAGARRGALAAEPWAGAARRQEARAVGSARVGIARAGCRHGHPAAPRSRLREGEPARRRGRPHRRQAPQRPDRHDHRGLPGPLLALRGHGPGRLRVAGDAVGPPHRRPALRAPLMRGPSATSAAGATDIGPRCADSVFGAGYLIARMAVDRSAIPRYRWARSPANAWLSPPRSSTVAPMSPTSTAPSINVRISVTPALAGRTITV